MRQRGSRMSVAVLLLAALGASGCGARWAYRQGQREAEKGNWDLAVARLTRALQKDPNNIEYKIALENARFQASRFHYGEARKHLAAENLERAVEELEIAVKYDPSNKLAVDELALVRSRIAAQEEEKRRRSDFEAMRARVQARQLPVPVLSPRSTAPIVLSFRQTSLQKVLESLGKIAGVNVLFDPDFRLDRPVDVNLTGVTFQQALDQLTFSNRLFYKVLDPNTIIIVPESLPKRRIYDDVLLRTFYLQNAEIKEIEAIIKPMLGTTARVVSNPSLGAITIIGTVDQLALAERIIELNDKARGEVLVEVEILEVNRRKIREYGIRLANYEVGATLAPTADPGDQGALPPLRAHILSSLNLSDFIVNIPTSLFARFLQTQDNARILAAPRLRASEGKPATLSIGTEVPIPVTTFTATQAGTSTFAPATSFTYRNVGVNLKITPRVNPAGEIVLELSAEFSLLGGDRNVGTGQNPINVPTFLTRKVEGILRLHDGETSLIGGLLQTRESELLTGALGLLDVPLLNRIFSDREKEKEDTEVVMSITPHLVRAPRVTETDLHSLYVGTQEAVRVPTARPPLFGTPEEPPVSMGPGPALVPEAPATPAAPPPAEAPPAETPPAPPSVPTGALRPVTATLSPMEGTLKVGGTASLSLVFMNARDLTGVEMVLTYDPASLEAVDVTPGTLLTLDGAAVGVERGLEPGRVRARLTRATPVSGSGMVASISFRGVAPGPGVVTVESLDFTAATGRERAGVATPARLTVTP